MKTIKGAVIGFIVSLILLVITIISYYTTSTFTLLGPVVTGFFKFFTFLYSWPYMLVALVFDLFHPFWLFVISSGTYTVICSLIAKYRNISKSHLHR